MKSFPSLILLDVKDDAVLLIGGFTAVCVFMLCFYFCYSGEWEHGFHAGFHLKLVPLDT